MVRNNTKLRRGIKMIRMPKAMKVKVLLGDQTFNHQLRQCEKWGE